MVPDEMVRWMMQRLMASTAQSFDLALSRFNAAEREAALAHARTLLDSDDPAERQLGEQLKAEITRVSSMPYEQVIEATALEASPQGNGVTLPPLSLLSSESSPATDTSSIVHPEVPQAKEPETSPSTSESTSALNGQPAKRPRGRPRKHPRPEEG